MPIELKDAVGPEPSKQFNAACGVGATKSPDGWVLEAGRDFRELIKQDGWTIHVKTQDVAPFAGQHNFISIEAPNGQTFMQIHGFGFERKTGEYSMLGDNISLRVVADNNNTHPCDVTEQARLFTGSFDEVMFRMGKALELGEHINSQNLDYILLDQNSNSVAHSMVKIMGFEMPKHMFDGFLSAVGHDKLLIPDNYGENSKFKNYDNRREQDLPMSNQSVLAVIKIDLLAWDKVQRQVAQDEKPQGRRLNIFDPKKNMPTEHAQFSSNGYDSTQGVTSGVPIMP